MIIEHENEKYEVQEITLQDLILGMFERRGLIKLIDTASKYLIEDLSKKGCSIIPIVDSDLIRCFKFSPEWFLNKGYAVKKQTKLEAGMILEAIDEKKTKQLFVSKTGRIVLGCGWVYSGAYDNKTIDDLKTLEDLNKYSIFEWGVKE
jgi:hypothetical protein